MNDSLSNDLLNDASAAVENRAGGGSTSTCPTCGAENPPDYLFCGHCGAALSNAAPSYIAALPAPPHATVPLNLATGRIWRRRMAILGSLLVSLAFVGWWVGTKPQEDGAANTVSTSATPILSDSGEEKPPPIKTLWEQGATAKRERRFADAASAWKQILEDHPKHPGIQPAIDKLPVAVSYSVQSQFNVAGDRCDVSYLNDRGKRVRLSNVTLPWRVSFNAGKGQRLSLTATSRSRQSPPSASIGVGGTSISVADDPTLWWLGYPTGISCRVRASYDAPSAGGLPDSGGDYRLPGTEDDASRFMDKVRAVLGENTDVLVANAQLIPHTDLLVVTLRNWDKIPTDVRLGTAQSIYRTWKGIRAADSKKRVYIMLMDESAQRLGGSKYPDGSQLWAVNQGKQGETIALPEGMRAGNDEGQDTQDQDTQTPDGDAASSDSDSSSAASDLDRYRQQLAAMPSMDRFVSGVTYLPGTKDSVDIIVTDEYRGLDYSARLGLAQRLLKVWQVTDVPSDPNRAHIRLKASDGTEVGGQSMMGAVWVEN